MGNCSVFFFLINASINYETDLIFSRSQVMAIYTCKKPLQQKIILLVRKYRRHEMATKDCGNSIKLFYWNSEIWVPYSFTVVEEIVIICPFAASTFLTWEKCFSDIVNISEVCKLNHRFFLLDPCTLGGLHSSYLKPRYLGPWECFS